MIKPKPKKAPRAPNPTRRVAALAKDPEIAARMLRLLAAEEAPNMVVDNPSALLPYILPLLAGRETEALVCVGLDRRRRVVEAAILTTGSDAFTVVCSRQILRWALTRPRAVSAIILAHNHPSGDPKPSPQDYDVTNKVAAAGRAVGVPLLDHIVVGSPGQYVSVAAEGMLPAVLAVAPGYTS